MTNITPPDRIYVPRLAEPIAGCMYSHSWTSYKLASCIEYIRSACVNSHTATWLYTGDAKTAGDSTTDERALFEAELLPRAKYPDDAFTRDENGEYIYQWVSHAWIGWQARAKLAADHPVAANKMVAARRSIEGDKP